MHVPHPLCRGTASISPSLHLRESSSLKHERHKIDLFPFPLLSDKHSYAPVTSTDAEDTGSSYKLSDFALDASSKAEDWLDPPL